VNLVVMEVKRSICYKNHIKSDINKLEKFIDTPGLEYEHGILLIFGSTKANGSEKNIRVLRKILGTLRNEKGTSIHERIMTMLATWRQRGLDCLQMLTAKLTC